MQAAQATLRQSIAERCAGARDVDASRTGYAEAKPGRMRDYVASAWMQAAQATLRQSLPFLSWLRLKIDASRTGYAEAKRNTNYNVTNGNGCKPHRLR